MIIRVVYQDGRFDYIKNSIFDQLLSLKKIGKFYRYSEGWVAPGVDPFRGVGGNYDGPERRMSDIRNER
jgi:hypothetical protein